MIPNATTAMRIKLAMSKSANKERTVDSFFDIREARAELTALRAERDRLREALEALFEHCVMTHKHWGEGCNRREADAAQIAARAALKGE